MSQYHATLVRGECYYLGNKRFDKNVPKLVSGDEKAHLEEHAVDVLNAGTEQFPKQKFKFEPVSGGETGGTSGAKRSGKTTTRKRRAASE